MKEKKSETIYGLFIDGGTGKDRSWWGDAEEETRRVA